MRIAIAGALATLCACAHPHPHPEGLPSADGPATPVESPPDAAMVAPPVEHPPVDTPAPTQTPEPVSETPAPTANPCGGGTATVATVEHGTLGHGSGYGTGGGGCGGRGRMLEIPTLAIGAPIVKGAGLDKAIVRRFLKQRTQQYLYCYEKQLLATPTIQGAVAAGFTIGADGLVTDVTVSGVDPDVASCVAGVLGSTELPKPKGGTPLTVTVTFTFRPK